MLSKKVKQRIAENRKRHADYPRLLREHFERERIKAAGGIRIPDISDPTGQSTVLLPDGVSQRMVFNSGAEFSTAEVMNRHYGIPANPPLDLTPKPGADEEVLYFEGSQKFNDDFLTIMIRAGNTDYIQIQERNLGFHTFGYIPHRGEARIRMEIFSVWAAPHTTFTMPLKVDDLNKRGSRVQGVMPYGVLAEVFEAEAGVKTYDRFRFLINQNPDVEDVMVDFNRSLNSGAEKN